MYKVGTVTLNNGGGSQGRQTATGLYYSVELPSPGEEGHPIGESERESASNWAMAERIYNNVSELGWNPGSLVTSRGNCSFSQGFPRRASMKTQADDT